MSRPTCAYWCLVTAALALAAQPPKRPAVPTLGIKTPGVRISIERLKPEAELHVAPSWVAFTDAVLIADEQGLYRIDPKKNELGPAVAPLNKPCGGAVNA